MVKSELILKVAKRFPHLSVAQIGMAVNTLFELMADALSNGKRIEIRGFGSFSLRYYNPRTLRNPSTGELLQNTRKRVRSYFRPGERLRRRVNHVYLQMPQKK